MTLSPIVTATLQSAVLSGTSNILAQAITAYRNDEAFIIDWVPVFQFFIFTFVITPPNFLWQDFLESTFPATHPVPRRDAIASAAQGDDKALDRSAYTGELVEPRLNVANTAAKTVLDQTLGAAANTFAFSLFMRSLQAAMAGVLPGAGAGAGAGGGGGGLAYLLASRQVVDFSRVDWRAVVAASRAEFWSIMKAGWRLWPFVSVVNFAFVKSIEGRNLVGSLAGVGWGIYMSLFAAGQ